MEAEYGDEHVCLSVSPHEYLRSKRTAKSSVLIASVSVFLLQCCDALCTSGFGDDVAFAHSVIWRFMCIPKRR